MIRYSNGTVFNSSSEVKVNTVNCFGIMGAGIALEFKLRYPEMFEEYEKACEEGTLKVGVPMLYKVGAEYILSFPTKNHWRYPSKKEWIVEGLKYFRDNYKKWGIKSVAFPKLGTNNGGLSWEEVKKVMEVYLGGLEDLEVTICLDETDAEGIELDMVNSINSSDIKKMCKELKIGGKQIDAIEGVLPVKRFWKFSTLNALSEKSYEKLFKHFYKKSIEKRDNFEQLSLI